MPVELASKHSVMVESSYLGQWWSNSGYQKPVASLEGVWSNDCIWAAMVAYFALDNSSRDAKAWNKVRVGNSHDVYVGAITLTGYLLGGLCVRALGDDRKVGHAENLYI